jgi:hypothetical protein
MEKIKALKLASALGGALAVSACSTTGGGSHSAPIGASSQLSTNFESCQTTTQQSINLILIGGSSSRNGYDEQCARDHLVRLLLTADLSHDVSADADMKAVALMIAGMQDVEVSDAIQRIVQDATPGTRMLIQQRVETYHENLQQQGQEELMAVLGPQIQALRDEIRRANAFHITMVKPEACSIDHYNHIQADMNLAYPNAAIQVNDATWTEMAVSVSTDSQVASMCNGSFLKLYAHNGPERSGFGMPFFLNTDTFNPVGPNGPEPMPQLDTRLSIAAITQAHPDIGISAEYQQIIAQQAIAERQQQALLEQQEAERVAALQAEAAQQQTQAGEIEGVQQASLGTSTTVPTPALDPNSCSVVRADFDTVRTYAVNGQNVSFELNGGDVSHFECPNAALPNGVNNLIYTAASFQSVSGDQPVTVLASSENVQDKPNGIVARIMSLVY